MREMEAIARDALSNLDKEIRSYLFEEHRPSYRTVLTNIRILLFDTRTPHSYEQELRGKCLLEAVYGDEKSLFLQSMNAVRYGFDVILQTGVAPGFDLSSNPEYQIKIARTGKQLMPLPKWKDENILILNEKTYTVGCVLRDLANLEGAHGFNKRKKGDWRKHLLGISFDSKPFNDQELPVRYFDVPTEQFVINAGLKLLFAHKLVSSRKVRLFDCPVTRITDHEINTFNLKKTKANIRTRIEDSKSSKGYREIV